jgi:glutamine amidotransferase
MKVALFDYGAGNLHSLGKALELGGATVETTSDWNVALGADALVLPGVGAFSSAVEALPRDRARVRSALEAGMPCLGICLGMQLFFDGSDEGEGEGIGLIPGRVRKLDAPVVPHMGWNDVHGAGDPLFAGMGGGLAGYYAHSYRCDPDDGSVVIGWSEYSGERLAAAVRYRNAWGVQFHPEKSSSAGLKLLANFLEEVKP